MALNASGGGALAHAETPIDPTPPGESIASTIDSAAQLTGRGDKDAPPVPLPGAMPLLLAGLAGLAFAMWRRSAD